MLSGGIVIKPSAFTQYYPEDCRRYNNVLSGGIVIKPSAFTQYYPILRIIKAYSAGQKKTPEGILPLGVFFILFTGYLNGGKKEKDKS